jgi:hypothetical protein
VISSDKQRLLLTELEIEVLQEALELYEQTRPVPFDDRFEYRYRAARTVLESLRLGTLELRTPSRGDDDEAGVTEKERSERRPLRERVED